MTEKILLICGGGLGVLEVAFDLENQKQDFRMLRLNGITDEKLAQFSGFDIDLGDFRGLFDIIKSEQITGVCMFGYVKRPDFSTIDQNKDNSKVLTDISDAGKLGDDALLRQVAHHISQQGVKILGVHEICPKMVLEEGLQVGPEPSETDHFDMTKALTVAAHIGQMDIGQAVIVAHGLVLSVEAQEGTQEMIKRIDQLPSSLKGHQDNRFGVLAKIPKPIQNLSLDMPTIGPDTLKAATASGLKGIVGKKGALLIVNRRETFALAEKAGIFIYGAGAE